MSITYNRRYLENPYVNQIFLQFKWACNFTLIQIILLNYSIAILTSWAKRVRMYVIMIDFFSIINLRNVEKLKNKCISK